MNRRLLTVLLLLLPTLGLAQLDPRAAVPPAARKIPHPSTIHGDTRQDDYHWLREKDEPAVRDYLEAENTYAKAVMKPTEPLQEKLYSEMLGRIKQTDSSVPYRDGEYWYYARTEQGKQYTIQCRKHKTLDAPEEVLIDINELAKGKSFLALGGMAVADLEESAFYEYGIIEDCACHQLLVIEVAAMDPRWGAVPATGFFWRGDAEAAEERMEGDIDAVGPMGDHLL